MTVTTLARSLATDGRFSLADAGRVIDEATRAGGAEEVRRLLADPDFFATADAGALRRLDEFLSTQAPSTGAIGALPDGSKVFLKEGCFLSAPDARLPSGPQEYGQSLYRASRLFAEPGLSVTQNLSLADKQAVTERVLVGLTQARPGDAPLGYDDTKQAAQQRSASATVLREIVSSLKGEAGQGKLLQDKALSALLELIKAETVPGLRDHMAFHLHAIRDDVATADQQARIDEAYQVFAPVKPPYDEWFKDGNRQLNVVCHTGGEFYKSEIELWKREGFTVVEEPAGYGKPTILEKSYRTADGEDMKVRLKMMSGAGGTFEDMDDDKTHIVAYSGHASWGRTMATELQRAPDEVSPTKLVLIHQCCGQGTINRFRDKYSKAQLVTTRHSSTEPADFFSFSSVLQGIAKQQSWTDIHDTISNGRHRNYSDNYITPADELTRMQTRDQDHDGKADLLDRLYDFDTFDVAGDTATSFAPKEPSARDRVLSGERVHLASQIVNTTLGFSHYLEHMDSGAPFMGGGHFDPKPGDADFDKMVRLVERKVDTRDLGVNAGRARLDEGENTFIEVQLNTRFAHASEEVLKAVTFFEVAMKHASGDTPLERALEGLMLVAHSLDVDDTYGREKMIFEGLREHYALPSEITYEDAKRFLKADSHVYAGSREGLRRYTEALSPDVKERVQRAVANA